MIYLLHFDRAVGTERNAARHSLCVADGNTDHDNLLAEHRAGRGNRLSRRAVASGATMQIVATRPGDRATLAHYQLTYKQCYTVICPVCNPRHMRVFQRSEVQA